MKLQSTLAQTRGDGRPNLLGFHFRSAMHDGIIGEPLKRHLRILLHHPPIKGIMQKQIGQQGTDDGLNAKDNVGRVGAWAAGEVREVAAAS